MKKVITIFELRIWKFNLVINWVLEEYMKTEKVIDELLNN